MPTMAQTTLGDLRGVRQDGVTVFRGVPYAAPPIGDLRFAAPQPAVAWAGVRDASVHGPIAPQSPSRLAAAMGGFTRPMDEDCLTLTIWTPAIDAGRRPVLVWLHGGAWISGAGSLDWYDGATLARDGNMVVVGVNYRLGALGYLKHRDLAVADPGTQDQIAALAWVAVNIGGVGGDPARVTVGGQSAGAASIGRLLLDPFARSLFHQAILQSGGFGRSPLNVSDAQVITAQYCRMLDIDADASDAVARMRAMPIQQLLVAQGALARARARFGETTPPFMPTLPDVMTEAELLGAIAAAAPSKPVLIGATREEVHAFFASNPAMSNPDPVAMADRFAVLGGNQLAYRRRRPGGSAMDLLADLTSDHTFLWPTMRLAEAISAAGGKAFAYQFDWAPPASRFRACHCIELPFVFGNFEQWLDAPMLAGGDRTEMEALSGLIRTFWTQFVAHGAPSGDWPGYNRATRATMRFGTICGVDGDSAGLGWRASV
jgi:para-nitrobenzyl esterase